jgi:hypothetical protein
MSQVLNLQNVFSGGKWLAGLDVLPPKFFGEKRKNLKFGGLSS